MLCVLIVEGMSVVFNVMLSPMNVMSPPPTLYDLSVRTMVKLCTFGVCFRGELGFLNCDDICPCVEYVFDSVYVDLQDDKISLILTGGFV